MSRRGCTRSKSIRRRGLSREFPARHMHHALISCAIKLLLYETGGEAALYGVQGEGTRRTAKKITDALQTRSSGVNKRPTGDPSTARFRNHS